MKFNGEAIYSQFGNALDVLGDVNNDGISDYIIGANAYDAEGGSTGKVYILSGADGMLLFSFTGENAGHEFGFSVASAGDVNNDSYDDFLIGAPFYDNVNSRSGKVYVFSGRTGDTLYTFSGSQADGFFGYSVSSVGDINDDNHDDLVIGEVNFDSLRGRVIVFSGVDGDTLYMLSGQEKGEKYGWHVTKMGDLDGDQVSELVVSAPAWGTNAGLPGSVYIYSGSTGTLINSFTGENASDYFGYWVSSAGDLNSDGFDDIIISARGYPNGNTVGKVYVFSGFDGDTLHVIESPNNSNHYFGTCVSEAGDANGDGNPDFIVSASFDTEAGYIVGKIFIYSGINGEIISEYTGDTLFSLLGISIAPVGDVNGDGYDDIIAGTLWDGETEYYTGSVYILSFADCFFNRGDVNHDGMDATVEDLTYMVDRMFRGGEAPDCPEESDVNSDGVSVNILDVTFLVNYIFRGGIAPGACY